MDTPSASGKKLNGILREPLEEISMGKTDLFHRVVAEVLEEVPVQGNRADENSGKTDTKPAGLRSIINHD